MTTGRNFQEILRTIDSMQRTAKHKIATPADWKPGEKVIIVPKVTNEEAKKIYPNGCCLLYTSPSPRDKRQYRMPSSA